MTILLLLSICIFICTMIHGLIGARLGEGLFL